MKGNRIAIAGALLALAAAAAPAHAQTNAELLRSIEDGIDRILAGMEGMLRETGAVLGDVRDLVDGVADLEPVLEAISADVSGMAGDVGDLGDAVQANARSLETIEAAMTDRACGEGTAWAGSSCIARITGCDHRAENGTCRSLVCGEGTVRHLDACVADVSVSYCGEGTEFRAGVCVAPVAEPTEPAASCGPGTELHGAVCLPAGAGEPEPEPEVHVVDGDTISVDGKPYHLAFVDAPGLGEPGGRGAVKYLDGLCGAGPLSVEPEAAPAGPETEALVRCGGTDANRAVLRDGGATFDASACAIRDFVHAGWADERCEPKPEPEPEPAVSCGAGTSLVDRVCVADIASCGAGTERADDACVVVRAEPEPPRTPDVFVEDGDTIRVDGRTYDLAFTRAPGLGEPGGRDALKYLDGLCGAGADVDILPESASPADGGRAVVVCGGLNANEAMVLAGKSEFDASACSARAFVGQAWTDARCGSDAEPAAAEPAPPDSPVRGQLRERTFAFPVTAGDAALWGADPSGGRGATATISCAHEVTPRRLAVDINQDPTAPYRIRTASLNYSDPADRLDSHVRLTAPRQADVFVQRFDAGNGRFVVYNQPADLLSLGAGTANLTLSMRLADWDDAPYSNRTLTAPEAAHRLFSVVYTAQTDIEGNDCTMRRGGASGAAAPQSRLLSLSGAAGSIGFRVAPYDVSCSETVTVTGLAAGSAAAYLEGYDRIDVTDRETGDDRDATVSVATGGQKIDGLSFRSGSFTVGGDGTGGNALVPAAGGADAGALALVRVSYTASSDGVCAWTRR